MSGNEKKILVKVHKRMCLFKASILSHSYCDITQRDVLRVLGVICIHNKNFPQYY